MDPAIAALIGASVGAVASVLAGLVGPWIRESESRRARRRDDLRELQRLEVLAVIEAFSNLYRLRYLGIRDESFAAQHTAAIVAINRLAIVTEARDRDLERMAGFALDAVADGHPKAAEVSLRLATETLHRWYRRELRGERIGDYFQDRLEEELRGSADG